MDDENWRLRLAAGARRLGCDLSPAQLESFAFYLEELRRWNRAYNLTRIIEPEAVVSAHFLDSLNYLPGLDRAGERVLDLGSGAGFPGLPLALLRPESSFLLCESRGKKALFLEHLISRLQINNVTIVQLHLSRQNARKVIHRPVSAVVCRAVNLLRDVVPVAAELLVPGGRLLFTETTPAAGPIRRELKRSWPGLVLAGFEKCLLPGRAPELYLGTITRRQAERPAMVAAGGAAGDPQLNETD